ncbi:MAG TPA: ECF-type sigma factor [Bryobacteraceae bacterium]|nr:ECF-type sigma factor [Bryobacteraceae bacterium]
MAQQPIAALLHQLKDGDKAVLDEIVPLVYGELHRMASSYLRGEYVQHTLQTTALVHEAYLRLAGGAQLDCQSLAHFYGIASRTMRQILVDHARVRQAAKRGGGAVHVPLDDALENFAETPAATIALDDALKALERQDPERARLVELRFFGGLTAEESARLLGLPVESVRHRLKVAQAWLRREIAESARTE